MKTDITNKQDILKIILIFYDRVKTDDVIGIFFTEVVQINWDKHIPHMVSFWESVLFYTGDYSGSPINTHRGIHQKYKTQPKHFARWIKLFNQVIDENYSGPNAEKMKNHTISIAKVMQQKI
ncbi:MAG TPA: group III truncated hemoglobin [Saprospiraceae bacterium]|jgi:hemoglobin|nr:MAG: globin family protein [Candidatus Parvibacillus calidus]MBX2936819.1 group III truncated hemoglobin [Saprospiraceae bacterium]MBX7179625.1 group III truncated hemoglobin [Saprospiraceae bacterium]MCB0591680.1 group III truncated hemoglobin [Saprospiraceae bacterium]MCC7148950.1 group III truncated hemoglobin [Saprospiraceae bacterium]